MLMQKKFQKINIVTVKNEDTWELTQNLIFWEIEALKTDKINKSESSTFSKIARLELVKLVQLLAQCFFYVTDYFWTFM